MRAILSFVQAAWIAAGISSAMGAQADDRMPVPDACALLSAQDVRDAVGSPVGEGESRFRTAAFTRCSFVAEHGGEIAILVRRLLSAEWVSEQLGRMNRGVQLGTYREVEGTGERSYFLMRTESAVLSVFADGYYLQVSLFRAGETASRPLVLQQLARCALARLGAHRSKLQIRRRREEPYGSTGALAPPAEARILVL